MIYRDVRPPTELRPFVRAIWTIKGLSDGSLERIVPDGCPEFIFNLGDRSKRIDNGLDRVQEPAIAVGQLTGPMMVEPGEVTSLLGIRFEPAGLHALTGVPPAELLHHDVALGDLSPGLHARLSDAAARDAATSRVDRTIDELMKLLGSQRRAHPSVGATMERLHAVGDVDISTISSGLGVSTRTLERRFLATVGVGPKFMHRVLRFAGVVTELTNAPRTRSTASIAAAHGYCDQPHLIRDFGLLAGTTPERFRREQTTWADGFAKPFDVSDLSNT
ncbi:MAG: helix-turn-helix domain-containing protein [Planctomycetota bacterium]